MSKDLSTVLLTGLVLAVGVGGALGAMALGSPEMAMSILGFAGGVLSGQVGPRLAELMPRKPKEEEE